MSHRRVRNHIRSGERRRRPSDADGRAGRRKPDVRGHGGLPNRQRLGGCGTGLHGTTGNADVYRRRRSQGILLDPDHQRRSRRAVPAIHGEAQQRHGKSHRGRDSRDGDDRRQRSGAGGNLLVACSENNALRLAVPSHVGISDLFISVSFTNRRSHVDEPNPNRDGSGRTVGPIRRYERRPDTRHHRGGTRARGPRTRTPAPAPSPVTVARGGGF